MARSFDHDLIRKQEDRRFTVALIAQLRTAGATNEECAEAGRSLSHLEDPRAIAPLTAVVEDTRLPASVRLGASRVLAGYDDTTTSDQRRHWWPGGDPVVMGHALRLMDRTEADIVAAVAGDDEHPLQQLALGSMAFGYDEERFQPVKVRALRHTDAKVREAAADVLVWDEAVLAADELIRAAADPSPAVAVKAVDTLHRKLAMYALRSVPKDSAVAKRAWQVTGVAGGIAACEAVQTYVMHARPEGGESASRQARFG